MMYAGENEVLDVESCSTPLAGYVGHEEPARTGQGLHGESRPFTFTLNGSTRPVGEFRALLIRRR